MKRAVSMALAGLTILAIALPASAATSTVQMVNYQFSPTPASVTVGDTVKWHNGDLVMHTATSNTKFFDLSVDSGQSKTHVFDFGGSFPYYCRFHGAPGQGMHGTVKVPDRWLNTGTQHVGDIQRIRVASAVPPAGLAFDVQMKAPGDGAFHAYKSKIKTAIVKFTPTQAGEFQFRSRLHRLSNDATSGWSPAAFVEIST
jgi:plastocyanin